MTPFYHPLMQILQRRRGAAAPVTPPFVPEGNVPAPGEQRVPAMAAPRPGPWWKDPALPGMLTTIGAALGQPRQIGQTGWGQAAQALAQGMQYRNAYQSAQQQAALEALDRWMKAQETQANIEKSQAEATRSRAEAETRIPAQAEAERAQAEYNKARAKGEPVRAGAEVTRAEALKERAAAAKERNVLMDKQNMEQARIDWQKIRDARQKAENEYKIEKKKLEVLEAQGKDKLAIERAKLALEAKKVDLEALREAEARRINPTLAATYLRESAALRADPILASKPEELTNALQALKESFMELHQMYYGDGKQQQEKEQPAVWKTDKEGRLPAEARGKIKVGDIVEQDGQRYKVVRFDEDGTPVVTKVE